MINLIKNHVVLAPFVEETCCENEVCVSFDGGVNPNDYAIVKVDKYYNSLKMSEPPPSIDCLIVRMCVNSGYGLTLVELKNISQGDKFDLNNIKGKFDTTVEDFIKVRFANVLDVDYSDIKLYFVSKQEIHRRDLGLKMKVLINWRWKLNKKNLMIEPRMPTPTIKNCYG